ATLFLSAPARAEQPLILGATTTTENSGLLSHLIQRFTAASGIPVRTIVQGSGAIIRTAAAGDFDAILVHDPVAEVAFVESGGGIDRRSVMFNDFLLVGPNDDPAEIRGLTDIAQAFSRIADAQATFASRADDSGTHKAELRIWAQAGLTNGPPQAHWYLETGSGMGVMLNIASARGAYAITDRGTWLSFANRGPLQELASGDPRLINHYSIIRTNPQNHPHLNAGAALAFADWLTGPPGQLAINDFLIAGKPAFIPHSPPRG
ncbi:MAG: substrate-binding domain-containing protein, partial [Alphaproteobacteria bacterium]